MGPPRPRSRQARIDATRATARDVLLIALAGPAASLVQVVLCAAAWTAVGGAVLWAGAFIGCFTVVLNLVPMQIVEHGTGRRVSNDGRLALDAYKAMRGVAPAHAAPPAQPLRGHRGVALGVEPLERTQPADDVAERARRLAGNASRSVPPPR